ncbi:MAG: helix-hairpin-helix domain-containing protein [Gracilimonas sp.]|jgi:comEA protein|nr:helix-hairpin-helix domain-containing protein [Gracilimonas sp.]
MNFNELKRKAFFWIDRLQISRTERIGITLLLAIILILLTANLFLRKTLNYDQERYDQIVAEFERRSTLIQKEEQALAEKYSPSSSVNTTRSDMEGQSKDSQNEAAQNDIAEPDPTPKIININEATLQELQSLKGIGPAYAQRILDYRQENDGFDSIDELVNVKGIGEKRLENIRPYIKLKD